MVLYPSCNREFLWWVMFISSFNLCSKQYRIHSSLIWFWFNVWLLLVFYVKLLYSIYYCIPLYSTTVNYCILFGASVCDERPESTLNVYECQLVSHWFEHGKQKYIISKAAWFMVELLQEMTTVCKALVLESQLGSASAPATNPETTIAYQQTVAPARRFTYVSFQAMPK